MFTSCAFVRFDPITTAERRVHALDEAERTTLGIRSVMSAHDLPDGFSRFIGMVKWDGGDIMMENVSLDDAVEELAANEAELAVNCGGCATGVSP